jgi:hypothetical protein
MSDVAVKEPVEPTVQEQQAIADKRVKQQKADYDAAMKQREEQHVLTNNMHVAGDRVRDRSLAVQEEISTRARDGISPNTPAAHARHEMIRKEFGEDPNGDTAADAKVLPVPERLAIMAARLLHITPSGCETMAMELMALSAEIGGGIKPVEVAPQDPLVPLTQQQRLDAERNYRNSQPFMTEQARIAASGLRERAPDKVVLTENNARSQPQQQNTRLDQNRF